MTFWILLAALTVFAVGLAVLPMLFGGRAAGATTAHEAELAVLRDRRDEIDRDLQAGRLTSSQAQSSQQELIDGLAETLTLSSETKPTDSKRAISGLIAPILAAVFIPVGAFGVYAFVGHPEVGAYLADNEITTDSETEQVAAVVDEIKARTQSHPDDQEAWLALAQARKLLGDYPAAVTAFERATTLGETNANVLAEFAESIALTKNRDFSGRPRALLERAFELDPQHVKVNALLGASYFQAGEREKSLPHLKRFVASIDPASQQAEQIQQLIDGIESSTAQRSTPPTPTAQTGTTTTEPATGAGLVSGSIQLSGEPPAAGSTIFIFARAATGPRMPFAVIREPVGKFPIRFEMSDANAMSPARKLSTAGDVVIEARISASGQAMRQSGDRFGVSEVIRPGNAEVSIQIDQLVP